MAKTTPSSNKKGSPAAKAPIVRSCNCQHEFQDQRYGKGLRLHNPRKEGKYACTVCGSLKEG